jgi:undecaprenyl-diphosphatase
LDRDLAARFSFLLSIPAIIGALSLQLVTGSTHGPGVVVLLAGGLTAAIVGLLALKLLMDLVRRGRFSVFAPYCWLIGLVVLLYTVF